MSGTKFDDMRGKAPLVTSVMNGQLDNSDQRKEFRESYFEKKYTRSATVEEIVRQFADKLNRLRELVNRSFEVNYDRYVQRDVEDMNGNAIDYLIQYADFPYGGLLCYELQRQLRDLMIDLRRMESAPEEKIRKIKKNELGAMQQMITGLLAAVQAMNKRGEKEFRWLSKLMTCEDLLNMAKNIASECLAARTIHGNDCFNLFAAAAVAKKQAIILKLLGEEKKAKVVFIKALKLYKEARGSEADPRADLSMQDLYQAFGVANAALERVDEAGENQSRATDSANEDSSRTCSLCLSRAVEVIYTECGHACLCRTCSDAEVLRGNADARDICQICHQSGPRRRMLETPASRTNVVDPGMDAALDSGAASSNVDPRVDAEAESGAASSSD